MIDLSDLVGKGVFAFLRNRCFFEQVRIGSFGELIWGEQADLCPDAFYRKATGKQPEEIFPVLRRESLHA